MNRIAIPLAPLRPSYKHSSFEHAFEAEQMITRAVTLEDNWRSDKPQSKSWEVAVASQKVLELALVPGGKFLIAAVKRGKSYFLSIYCLEHPGLDRGLLIAEIETKTRVYGIQAKYMKVGGVEGIVLLYVRREWKEPTELNAK